MIICEDKNLFGTISHKFQLRSQISSEWIDTTKIRKASDQIQPFPHWAKNWRTLVH